MIPLTPPTPELFSLPIWIGNCDLTLSEIGVIACLASISAGFDSSRLNKRMDNEEALLVMRALKDKGVITVKEWEAGKLTVIINLDKVAPR